MSKFVRYYKKCINYRENKDWCRTGCVVVWKGMELIMPCFEECGIRCKRYEVKS